MRGALACGTGAQGGRRAGAGELAGARADAHAAGAQGRTSWRRRGRARQARGLCAQAVPAGPVLVLVHLAWFSTWFFDSVFFLSH